MDTSFYLMMGFIFVVFFALAYFSVKIDEGNPNINEDDDMFWDADITNLDGFFGPGYDGGDFWSDDDDK